MVEPGELLGELLAELLLELPLVDADELLLVLDDIVELELDDPIMEDELVLIDIERVFVDDMLPVVELELEELEELLGGPAEYTTAPAGWAMR